jgi:hypothetical protein
MKTSVSQLPRDSTQEHKVINNWKSNHHVTIVILQLEHINFTLVTCLIFAVQNIIIILKIYLKAVIKILHKTACWYLNFRPFFFCSGAATQRGSWPPHSWGFLITHNDAPQSVGLFWTSDQLVAETSTWQHTTLRTHDLSRRGAADLRLRPRGHWERLILDITICNYMMQ